MPSEYRRTSLEASKAHNTDGRASLKKHKVLPRPRDDLNPDFYTQLPEKRRTDLQVDTGTSSKSSSESDSPRILKHAAGRVRAPELPPTPPNNSSKSSGTYSETESAPKQTSSSINGRGRFADVASAPTTPPHQKSPPTPDVTPPRHMPLIHRQPLTERYPSSRAESFKTAPEQQSSSEEDVTLAQQPVLPPVKQSRPGGPKTPESTAKHKSIGLGLGLESDNEGTASTTPRPYTSSHLQEITGFDGTWESPNEDVSEVGPEWDDNLMRNVTVRKRGRPRQRTEPPTPEVKEDNVISPTLATKAVRNLPLQEQLARHQLERQASDRTLTRTPKRIVSDTKRPREVVVDRASPIASDTKRSSTVSAYSVTSTVVEAMVVESTPQRIPTLRHRRKQYGLRDVRPETPNQDPEARQRLLLHKSSERNIRAHQSIYSNATTGTSIITSKKARQSVVKSGGIPVVVIPDRRSSSKPNKPPSLRSTSSRRTKRSASLSSAPLSASSKYNDPDFQFRGRKRTMSESASSRDSDQRTMDFPPVIPARRSSLSAPTSRNTSRAGSLTAESLNAHNMMQLLAQKAEKAEKAGEPEKSVEKLYPESPRSTGDHKTYAESQGDRNTWLTVDHNGDPFFGTRMSTQPTPFSQASYDTAVTNLEVSEALAVSIFPHQNKSVVVVDQPPAPSANSLPRVPRLVTSQIPKARPLPEPPVAEMPKAKSVPVTPPQSSNHLMDEVDSPLRNPRAPPPPPVIKFIPATPSEDDTKQLGSSPGNNRPGADGNGSSSGSLSLLWRALSKRRESEPAVPLIRRTFSLSGKRKDESTQTSKANAKPETLYPTVMDQPPDSTKLHPFWRPAKFWDDLEDEDESFYHDYLENHRRGRGRRHSMYDDRSRMPERSLSWKLKNAFTMRPPRNVYEPAVERRAIRKTPSGNMRVVKRRSNSSLRRSSSERSHRGNYYPPRSTSTPPPVRPYPRGPIPRVDEIRPRTMSGLGLKVEYVGFSGLKRRLSEKRREQRSEKLRASISHPQGVRSGVDDVLRGHTA
ncbi:hypothetical protein F5884DRAFT_765614 [Xylogone sp. PMI_703]|nr:hypothetical protein F5884DRAFT_765614 [Xylogone sp. PMI_703]